jgi:hypothetical protein
VRGNGGGNHCSDEEAGNGSVAIRKMEDVRLFALATLAELHAGETSVGEAAVIITRCVAIKRRGSVNADGEKIIGVALEKRKYRRIGFANLGEVIGVADLRKALALSLNAEVWKVVDLFGVEALDVLLSECRERGLRQKLTPGCDAKTGNKFI